MDELFLYDRDKGLFKEILKKSKVINGRYHVSPSYGHDLNTNNLDSFIKDPLYGLIDPEQKYPLVVCMAPQSILNRNESGSLGEQFFFELFFLCTSGYTGQNKIKSVDKPTQTSGHHTWYDWKDMKELAVEFLETFKQVVIKYRLKQYLSIDFDRIPVRRVSKFNNDLLSGVSISFIVDIVAGICELSDYESDAVETIVIPPLIIHPLHKH